MKKPIMREHNCETNEFLDREMTEEEYQKYQLINAEREAQAAENILKLEAKNALLERLGMTAEEAKLLLS